MSYRNSNNGVVIGGLRHAITGMALLMRQEDAQLSALIIHYFSEADLFRIIKLCQYHGFPEEIFQTFVPIDCMWKIGNEYTEYVSFGIQQVTGLPLRACRFSLWSISIQRSINVPRNKHPFISTVCKSHYSSWRYAKRNCISTVLTSVNWFYCA